MIFPLSGGQPKVQAGNEWSRELPEPPPRPPFFSTTDLTGLAIQFDPDSFVSQYFKINTHTHKSSQTDRLSTPFLHPL